MLVVQEVLGREGICRNSAERSKVETASLDTRAFDARPNVLLRSAFQVHPVYQEFGQRAIAHSRQVSTNDSQLVDLNFHPEGVGALREKQDYIKLCDTRRFYFIQDSRVDLPLTKCSLLATLMYH